MQHADELQQYLHSMNNISLLGVRAASAVITHAQVMPVAVQTGLQT